MARPALNPERLARERKIAAEYGFCLKTVQKNRLADLKGDTLQYMVGIIRKRRLQINQKKA